jgi:hypothetical protein
MAQNNVVPLPVGLLSPTALRQPQPELPQIVGDVEVSIATPDGGLKTNPDGTLSIEGDDGSVVIDLDPGPEISDEDRDDFGANLAEQIDSSELARIADETLRGIQFDEQSRAQWLETRAQGIRLLGLEIGPPRSATDSTASVEGMSNVRHPLLLEATLRFQANARGELLPADGPVKVTDSLAETGANDTLAEKLEDSLNYYLTKVATEYYPDTDRMLFYVGFSGCGFKKVYNCPLRLRPVSESIDAKDVIVSNAATDMRNSGRVTHVITMRPAVLKRMQIAGAYRDVPISTPSGVVLNPVDRQIADTQGITPNSQQTEDRDHTIYETYCELDIRGFEDRDNDGITGLPLPYRVVIDKDSRQVLEIRRNWREEDETKAAKVCLVKYSFVPGLGFYDIGLLQILGNTTSALTAAWRELLDAGMFANFPGFLYAKQAGRQNTNEFRVPPGGGAPIDTEGQPISEMVMPLPYKDISVAFAQFIDKIAETGQRVGGTAEVQIAEGRQDAPVGTTLAMIEQATKIEGAVHKRLHAAQAEEFALLKDCFRENPKSFIRAMKRRGQAVDWDEESFLAALDDATITPVADPNTPSHMHRLMKAMALVQMDKAYPGVMDPVKLVARVAEMIRVDDFDSLLAPPNPNATMPPELQIKQAELADKQAERDHSAIAHQRALQLQAAKDQSEQRQQQHEVLMQQRESADQAADRQARLQEAVIAARSSAGDNQAQVMAERLKVVAAEIDASAEDGTSDKSVKVAEETTKQAAHGVKAAEHEARGEEHRARGEEAKAKAAALKPKPKPASKK